MKYQLVLQMPFGRIGDYEEMIRFEDAMLGELGHLASVDGHDAGSAEMNILSFHR